MVQDILYGSESIIIRREEDDIELELEGSDVKADPEDLPDEAVSQIEEDGYEFTSPYPQSVTLYLHDEASPRDRREIAEDLNLSEDDPLVQQIANIGYEVSIDVEVPDKSTFRITAVDGAEFEDPPEKNVDRNRSF